MNPFCCTHDNRCAADDSDAPTASTCAHFLCFNCSTCRLLAVLYAVQTTSDKSVVRGFYSSNRRECRLRTGARTAKRRPPDTVALCGVGVRSSRRFYRRAIKRRQQRSEIGIRTSRHNTQYTYAWPSLLCRSCCRLRIHFK